MIRRHPIRSALVLLLVLLLAWAWPNRAHLAAFPDIIGAKIVHGAQPMTPYKAITPNANVAPKVDFK